jgi:HK97 family phage portal protein
MGLFDFLNTKDQAPLNQVDVSASLSPFEVSDLWASVMGSTSVTAANAISVPSVARAKNIICTTIGTLPKEQYVKATGAHLEPNRCINQPDKRIAGAVVYSWLAFDMWFYGVGYGVVNEVYSDGRIADWTRVPFEWVTPEYNSMMSEIIGYSINGMKAPLSGVGSVIAFQNVEEGFGTRAGRTVNAAIWLEKAALNYAKNPVPATVLKSNGTNLTSERIRSLITAWTKSRQENSTAFLNADVNLEVLGFDPAKMQLTEARQYVALELARHAGIPAYFISAEASSMTYSNAISERKALIDFSLRPILTAIEQRLSMSDFIPSGTEIRHSVDDFLRGDPLQRAQVYQILNSIGAMSVAQIQEEEDLIDNGN